MARVLLVDAAFSAEPLLRALQELGHEVVTIGNRPRDALVTLSDKHILADYSDTSALESILKKERIDFLVPGCTDRSYASCVAMNREGRYPGLDTPQNSTTLHDKRAFRDFCEREGLSAPKRLSHEQALKQPAVMVKPVDAFSGQGITRLEQPSHQTLAQATAQAKAASPSAQVILEPYIQGQLYSHSAFIAGGHIIREHWVKEYCAAQPFVVDLSHLARDLPESLCRELSGQIEHLAQALALSDGLLHTQFIRHGSDFWLIETTRRCPGDLYSQLIQLSGAPGYARAYTASFLGDKPQAAPQNRSINLLRHTLSCPPDEPFYWANYSPSVPLRAFIPLMRPGERAGRQTLRAGIAFYHCPDASSLAELSTRLSADPWMSHSEPQDPPTSQFDAPSATQ